MIDEKKVASSIIEHVEQHPTVFGAKLGAYVNAEYPGLHLRATYGGLKKFVERFCNGEVVVTGKYGKDDIYQHASAVGSEIPTAPPAPQRGDSAWRAFTSPSCEARLTLSAETGSMRVMTGGEELQPAEREIPKITTEEHRGIAREFLPQIEEEERPLFQEVLLRDDFWDIWFEMTRTHSKGKYLKGWLAFRFEELCRLFLERLKVLELPEDMWQPLLQTLKSSKSGTKRLERRPISYVPEVAGHRRAHVTLRAAIIGAAEALSEEELRRVWLPAGVLADALRGKQP